MEEFFVLIMDVTPLKNAERNLQISQRQLREHARLLTSINQHPLGSFVYRMELPPKGQVTFTYVSPTSEDICGMSVGKVVADAELFYSLVLKDDLTDLNARIATSIHTNDVLDVEVRLLHAGDYSMRWLRLRGRTVEQRPDGVVVREGIATDITAAKEVEAENRILALVAARTLNAVILTDASGHIEWVNEGFTRITGYTLEEVRGRKPGSILQGPETDLAVVEEMSAALRAKRAVHVELINYGKQGRKYWLEIEIQPLHDAHGHVTHFMAIEKDITERKAAVAEVHRLNESLELQVRQRTERLTTSEERFRMLAENMRDLLCMIDVSGRFVYVSPSFHSVLDYPIEDLLGSPVLAQIHADDFPEISIVLQSLLSGTPAVAVEFRFRHNAGHFVWLEASGCAVPSTDGTVKSYVVTARDITERKMAALTLRASEERFRTLVEWSPEGIFLHRDGQIVYVNPTSTKQLGATSAQDLVGRRSLDVIHPDYRDHEQARVERVTKERLDAPLIETRFIRLDGTVLDVETQATSIIYDGLPTVYVAWRDISARKQAEATRAQLEGMIFKSQKFEALGTLAGGVAHDFNNILTGIINYTALARSDCPDTHPEVRGFLGEVLKCCDRAKELVRQILLFSRSEDAEHVPLLLQHVIKEVMSLLRSTIPTNVKIETIIDLHAPVVLGNATQVHQVMMNLGINASHAMRERGGLLTVKLHQRTVDSVLAGQLPELREGAHVCVEVTDTGCGMPPTVLARIFEPFFTTKQVGEGTGLGLAVAHSVMRSHRGAISVSSRPGHGTTFELYFPAMPVCLSENANHDRVIPHGRGQRILLVDDETIIATSVQKMLERLGYHVTVFFNPEHALGRFWTAPHEFDALIVDFQMPGMTGIDIARNVLDHRPAMPIFVASGFTGTMTEETMRSEGITKLLPKPIDMAELAQALAETLN